MNKREIKRLSDPDAYTWPIKKEAIKHRMRDENHEQQKLRLKFSNVNK